MNARARDDARCVANDARLTTMRARRTNDDASVSFFCFSPSAVVRGKKRDSDAGARARARGRRAGRQAPKESAIDARRGRSGGRCEGEGDV